MLLKLPFCKTVHEVHLNRQESYQQNKTKVTKTYLMKTKIQVQVILHH